MTMGEIMKILFVVSGNHERGISPIVKNQMEALQEAGVVVDLFEIRGRGVFNYLKNTIQLRHYLRKHLYFAIHAHYSLSGYVASLAGAKPLVVSLMGTDVKAAGWYKSFIKLFAKLFRWGALIVKSNDMYRDLGMAEAIVFPNSVNTERFMPMDKQTCQEKLGWTITHNQSSVTHILFPANYNRPEKDFPLAEEAVALVKQHFGDKREIEIHWFDDYTPNAALPDWYNAADVVLLTSFYEGSPNVIKEALACSKPIVSTNVGDVAERMDGVEGCYVVSTREPKDVADALEKALAFDGLTKGRENIFADELSNQQAMERLKNMYKSVQNK